MCYISYGLDIAITWVEKNEILVYLYSWLQAVEIVIFPCQIHT